MNILRSYLNWWHNWQLKSRRRSHTLRGSLSMGDGQIFLKTCRDVSFNKVLSNEPTFGRIHLVKVTYIGFLNNLSCTVYLSSFFIKAIGKELTEYKAVKRQLPCKVTWGLYWVMCRSSCDIIRPLWCYHFQPLLARIFRFNASESCGPLYSRIQIPMTCER